MDIFKVKDKQEGARKGLELLGNWLTSNTLLLLSGGSSPQELYKLLASSKLTLGGIATIDERYGPPGHKESNERMFEGKGIYKWAEERNAQILRMLDTRGGLTETAKAYEHKISQALQKFTQKVAVMGAGADGHTAGIAPGVSWWDTDKLVMGYKHEAPGWQWPERITLTFAALQEIDKFLVLLFGEKKRKVLKALQSNEVPNIQHFPAAFYLEVASKTTIINKVASISDIITDIE